MRSGQTLPQIERFVWAFKLDGPSLAAVQHDHARHLGGDGVELAFVFGQQQFVFQAALVLDLLDGVAQAAQFLDRHIPERSQAGRVDQRLRDVGRVAGGFLLGIPAGQTLALVQLLVADGAKVEFLQQLLDLVQVSRVDGFGALVELLEVFLQRLDLFLRCIGRFGRIQVDQLVALVFGLLGQIACRLDRCTGRTHLGRRILAGPNVAHLELGNDGLGVLFGRLRQHVHRVLFTGHLRAHVHGVLQRLEFGGHEAGARFVVNGHIGGALDARLGGQVTMVFQHAQVGQDVDDLLRRLSLGQRLNQLVARAEFKLLGHHVRGLAALLRGHLQLLQPAPWRIRLDAVGLLQFFRAELSGFKERVRHLGQRGRGFLWRCVGLVPVQHGLLDIDAHLLFVLRQKLAALQSFDLGVGCGQRVTLGLVGGSFGVDALLLVVRERLGVVRFGLTGLVGLHRLGRQVGPHPIDGLTHHLGARSHGRLFAQRVMLFLERLERTPPGLLRPLQIFEAARLQFVRGVHRGLHARVVVGLELVQGHTGLFGRLEQRPHTARRFGFLNLAGSRQHPVHHAAHFVGQLDIERAGNVGLGQAAVYVDQPGTKGLEHARQLHAGRFAFKGVGLEAARPLFMQAALLLQRHGDPFEQRRRVGRAFDAQPVERAVHIVQDGLFAFADRLALGNARGNAGGQIRLHFKEEVPALMDEGR